MSRISELNYDILVSQEAEKIRDFILDSEASSVFILVDENTRSFCLPILNSDFQDLNYTLIEIPSGEQNKNLKVCEYIWEKLLDGGADRKSLLILLGGGVLGDMGGFVASSYMRGIPFIQIPTTLLSQVDASVGSKLGINFQKHKNIIGLFNDPLLNWINPGFLSTLPYRHIVNGYAEIIKHALIQSVTYWNKLKEIGGNFQNISWEPIIMESIKIKSVVVKDDKFESGKRKILNFGHTIGHAVESYSFESGQNLLHGEAIALGMICESYISFKKDILGLNELDEITGLIRSIFMERIIVDINPDRIIEFCLKDKKNHSGLMNFSLLNGIGNCLYDQEIEKDLISEALNYVSQYEK